jgi:hypothetical protein
MAVRLNRDEQVVLGTMAARVDLSRVLLHRGERPDAIRRAVLWASRGRAVTLGNHIFLPDHCAVDVPVLAHELTHCGQYQAWGAWTYFRRGLITQCWDLLHRTLGIGESQYAYRVEAGKPFESYGMEQQGQIVEDCFRGDCAAQGVAPFGPQSEEV